MSEGDLREGLRAAVGDEPPLHFDADELIRRAEHARRRRRALVAVAVATLALTGTVLSLPGVFDQGSGIDAARGPVLTITSSPSRPQAQSPAPSSAPIRTTRPASPLPPGLIVPEGTAKRLEAHLAERFTEVVPGAKILEVDFTGAHEQDRDGFLTGVVRFHDGVGVTGVVVQLSTPGTRLNPVEFCTTVVCDESLHHANGGELETTTATDPESGRVTRTVAQFRTDGSAVLVSGYNHDPTTGGEWRPGVAVTVDQLVWIAADPKLTVG